jgi:hypothetical protein
MRQTPDQNLPFSPTAILTFGLLDNGADAEARSEIESVFEFTGPDLVPRGQLLFLGAVVEP